MDFAALTTEEQESYEFVGAAVKLIVWKILIDELHLQLNASTTQSYVELLRLFYKVHID